MLELGIMVYTHQPCCWVLPSKSGSKILDTMHFLLHSTGDQDFMASDYALNYTWLVYCHKSPNLVPMRTSIQAPKHINFM